MACAGTESAGGTRELIEPGASAIRIDGARVQRQQLSPVARFIGGTTHPAKSRRAAPQSLLGGASFGIEIARELGRGEIGEVALEPHTAHDQVRQAALTR